MNHSTRGAQPTARLRTFVDALPLEHPLRDVAAESASELEDALALLGKQVEVAHPTIGVGVDDVLRFIGNSGGRAATTIEELGKLRLADLKLATGCHLGVGAALAIVESELIPQVRAALARLDKTGGDQTDEALQVAREKLFVRMKVASYQGRGAFGGFIEVTATREALMLIRGRQREVGLEDSHFLSLAQVESDPVLEYVRNNYRSAVETAFASALESLEVRDRALLRYAFVHGLSSAQIGVIYNVHKATAFRWLRAARARLLEQLRSELASSLSIETEDVESAIRLIRSRVELTLERVLESKTE